jgi:hypothetical protein
MMTRSPTDLSSCVLWDQGAIDPREFFCYNLQELYIIADLTPRIALPINPKASYPHHCQAVHCQGDSIEEILR